MRKTVILNLDAEKFFEYAASAMVDKHHCRYHPERKSLLYCEKYEYGYCEQCLAAILVCTDPELYCKFRTHCIIWENCREDLKNKRVSGK
jgi:hypothetical protein